MKYILLFITISGCTAAFSQDSSGYVDSLKRIINKGIHFGEDKKTINKHIAYIKACDALGDYYRQKGNFRKALDNYLLVANLGESTDNVLGENMVPIKLRNKVCLKAADILFYGRGIKRDGNAALHLTAEGLRYTNNSVLTDHYSKLYFNTSDPLFFLGSEDTMKFAINILNAGGKIISAKLKNDLQKLIVRLNSDTTLACTIVGESPPTMLGQSLASRSSENVRDYIKNKIASPARMDSQLEISNEVCSYKYYNLPCLQIIISRQKINK